MMASLLFALLGLLVGCGLAAEVPSTSLADGQLLNITVQTETKYGGVRFFTCSDAPNQNCSQLWIGEDTPDGLCYNSWIECKGIDFPCTRVSWVFPPSGRNLWLDGQFNFTAYRSDDTLWVQLNGKEAYGPIPHDATTIFVTPDDYAPDRFDPREFSVSFDDVPFGPTPAPTHPTESPAVPTSTAVPTAVPTDVPTSTAVPASTAGPTAVPTAIPTSTAVPTSTAGPTAVPTAAPTDVPTSTAVPASTAVPTAAPTDVPTSTVAPASPTQPTIPPHGGLPLPAPTACAPEYTYLLIPVAGRCDEYQVCYSGRSQLMPCPDQTKFNYRGQVCDWVSDGEC